MAVGWEREAPPTVGFEVYLALLAVALLALLLLGAHDLSITGFLQRHWPGVALRVDGSALMVVVILVLDALLVALLLRRALVVP